MRFCPWILIHHLPGTQGARRFAPDTVHLRESTEIRPRTAEPRSGFRYENRCGTVFYGWLNAAIL